MISNIEKLTAPIYELNAIMVKNIEKLAEIGLKSIEENTAVAVESMKEALEVKDLEGWKKYVTNRMEANNGVVESTIANAREVTELAKDYVNETKGIVEGAMTAG